GASQLARCRTRAIILWGALDRATPLGRSLHALDIGTARILNRDPDIGCLALASAEYPTHRILQGDVRAALRSTPSSEYVADSYPDRAAQPAGAAQHVAPARVDVDQRVGATVAVEVGVRRAPYGRLQRVTAQEAAAGGVIPAGGHPDLACGGVR